MEASAPESRLRSNVRDAEVQCKLPDDTVRLTGNTSSQHERIMWVQKTIFSCGDFISVREIGLQTDPPQDIRTFNAGSTLSQAFFDPSPVRILRNKPASGSRAASVGKTPRTGRPARGSAEEQDRIEEIQQQMVSMTVKARDRALALEERVEDLNHRASAALVRARHTNNDLSPRHAFECGVKTQRSIMGRSTDGSRTARSEPRSARSCNTSSALPDVGGRQSSKMVSTKMPWQALQEDMPGCPNAALGCKVLLTSVEPWKPSVLSELPSLPQSLTQRLATSANVYLPPGGIPKDGKQRKPRTTSIP